MSIDVSAPPLFDLLERKLDWIDARQRVLAENVANIDTPGYRPKEMRAFTDHLAALGVSPVRTNPMHLAGYDLHSSISDRERAEHAPDGNAVGLEDQLKKVADNESAQALTGNLWKTYMGMFMTALGHG